MTTDNGSCTISDDEIMDVPAVYLRDPFLYIAKFLGAPVLGTLCLMIDPRFEYHFERNYESCDSTFSWRLPSNGPAKEEYKYGWKDPSKTTSFGMASKKTEGYIFDLDGSETDPHQNALDKKLSNLKLPFYLKPFEKKIKDMATQFWYNACLEKRAK